MNQEVLQTFLAFAFGTAIGSFLNVLIWRLPRDKKPTGRSYCPNCQHQLIWIDLIPIFSYLVSGGKCRYCKKKISPRYLIIELITGLLFAAAYVSLLPVTGFGFAWLAFDWFIISVLVVVFVIDFEHYLILDKVVYPATVVVLLFGIVMDWADPGPAVSSFMLSILGMVAGFLPFFILWVVSKGKWIGLGDAKFGLFLGAVFGFPLILITYFFAFVLGTFVSVPLLLSGKKELGSKLPLGTFLSLSALVMIWYGERIMNWYLTLIGLA